MDCQEEGMTCVSRKADDKTEGDCDLVEIDDITIIGERRLIDDEVVCDSYLKDDLKDFISDEVVSDSYLQTSEDDCLISHDVNLTNNKPANIASLQNNYCDIGNSIISEENRTSVCSKLMSHSNNKDELTSQSSSDSLEIIELNPSRCKKPFSSISALSPTKSCSDSPFNRINENLSEVNLDIFSKKSANSSSSKQIVQCIDLEDENEENNFHLLNSEESTLCPNSKTRNDSTHNNASSTVNDKSLPNSNSEKNIPQCTTYKENIIQSSASIAKDVHCFHSEDDDVHISSDESNMPNTVSEHAPVTPSEENKVLIHSDTFPKTIPQSSNFKEIDAHCSLSKENDLQCDNQENTNLPCSVSEGNNDCSVSLQKTSVHYTNSDTRKIECINTLKSNTHYTDPEEMNINIPLTASENANFEKNTDKLQDTGIHSKETSIHPASSKYTHFESAAVEETSACCSNLKENGTQCTGEISGSSQYVCTKDKAECNSTEGTNSRKSTSESFTGTQCTDSEVNAQCSTSETYADKQYTNLEETNLQSHTSETRVQCTDSEETNIQCNNLETETGTQCTVSEETNTHCDTSETYTDIQSTDSKEANLQCINSEGTNRHCSSSQKLNILCNDFGETSNSKQCTNHEKRALVQNTNVKEVQHNNFEDRSVCINDVKKDIEFYKTKQANSPCSYLEETNSDNEEHCGSSKEIVQDTISEKNNIQCTSSEENNARFISSEETNEECHNSSKTNNSFDEKNKSILQTIADSSDSAKSENLHPDHIKRNKVNESSLVCESSSDRKEVDNVKEKAPKPCLEASIKERKNTEVVNKDPEESRIANKMESGKSLDMGSFKYNLSKECRPVLKRLVVCMNKVKDCDLPNSSLKENDKINETRGEQSLYNKEPDSKSIEIDTQSLDSLSESPVTKTDLCNSDHGSEISTLSHSDSCVKQLTCTNDVILQNSAKTTLPVQDENSVKKNSEDSSASENQSENSGIHNSKPDFLVPVEVNALQENCPSSRSLEESGNAQASDLELIKNKTPVSEPKTLSDRLRLREPEKLFLKPGVKRKPGRPKKVVEKNLIDSPKIEDEADFSGNKHLSKLTETNSSRSTLRSKCSSESKDIKVKNSLNMVKCNDTSSTTANAIEKGIDDSSTSNEENKKTSRAVSKTKLTSRKKIKVILKLSPKRNIRCNFSSIITQPRNKSALPKASTTCIQKTPSTQINNKLVKEKESISSIDQTPSPISKNRFIKTLKSNVNEENLDTKNKISSTENDHSVIEKVSEDSEDLPKTLANCSNTERSASDDISLGNDSVSEDANNVQDRDAGEKKETKDEVVEPKLKTGSEVSSNLQQRLQRVRRRSPSKLSLRMKQEVQEQCCGHWFPNTKRFVRHLIDNSTNESDSIHTAKLLDLGMQKCSLCTEPVWLNFINMKKHTKMLHDVAKLTLASNSQNSAVASVSVSNSSGSPDISKSSSVVTANIPQKILVKKPVKMGPKSKRFGKKYKEYKEKPCPMSKKKKVFPCKNNTRILCDLSQDPVSSLSSLSVYSIEDLPNHFKPLITVPRYKDEIRKKRVKMKRISRNLDDETLLSIKNRLKKFKDLKEISDINSLEVDEKIEKPNSEKRDKVKDEKREKSKDEKKEKSKDEKKEKSKDEKREKPKDDKRERAKDEKKEKPKEEKKEKPKDEKKEKPKDEKREKPKDEKKEKLEKRDKLKNEKSKSTCKVDSVNSEHRDSVSPKNQTDKEKQKIKKADIPKLKRVSKVLPKTPTTKQINLRSQKQCPSEPLSAKSLNESQKKESTPKIIPEKSEMNQDEDSKSRRCSIESIPNKKSYKKRRSRYSLDPDFMTATPLGRIRIRGRKRGRPRKRKCEFASSDSSNASPSSDSSSSDFERNFLDDEWQENEENIPTVELDLFTLSSLNEDVSVLLVDPKNPNFKVYASMDAIFVGDSALGDVTNQLGYISDNNNVVYVNPSHFLFPKIGSSEKDVPVLKSSNTFRVLRHRLKERDDLPSDSSARKTVKILKKGSLFSIAKNSEAVPIVLPTHNNDDNNKENSFTKAAPPEEVDKENNVNIDDSKSFKPEVKVSKEVYLSVSTPPVEEQIPLKTPPKEVQTPETQIKEKESSSVDEAETTTTEVSQLKEIDEEVESPNQNQENNSDSEPKTLRILSGIPKRENLKPIEQVHNKVIIIKTSVKKDANSEKDSKPSSDTKVENTSEKITKTSPPNIISLEEAATVSRPTPVIKKATEQEKVIKTLTVNSIKNIARDFEKNVAYRVLADSKNPIIPGNIDYSSLETIDAIDYDSVDNSQDLNSNISNEVGEISKENDYPNTTESSNIISKDTAPIITEPKPLSPVKISTDSRVVVASAEILPFGTIENGVCLEEVVPEVDNPPVEQVDKISSHSESINKESDVKSKLVSDIVKSSLMDSVSDKSFELENDSLNSLSDLEVSSCKDSEGVAEPYSLGDINDIVQGNNLWSTPLLPLSLSENTNKGPATDSENLPSDLSSLLTQKGIPQKPETPKKGFTKENLCRTPLSLVPKMSALKGKFHRKIKSASPKLSLNRYPKLSAKRGRRKSTFKPVAKAPMRRLRKQTPLKRISSTSHVICEDQNGKPKNSQDTVLDKIQPPKEESSPKLSEPEKILSHPSFAVAQPFQNENLPVKKHRKQKKRKKKFTSTTAIQNISQPLPGSSEDVLYEKPKTQISPDPLKMRILLKDLPMNDSDSFDMKGSFHKRKKKKKHSKKKRREREELESLTNPSKKKKLSSEVIVSPVCKQEPDDEDEKSESILASYLVREQKVEPSEERIVVDEDYVKEVDEEEDISHNENEAELEKRESDKMEKSYVKNIKKKQTPVKTLVLKQFDTFRVAPLVKKEYDNFAPTSEASSDDENTNNQSIDSGMDLTMMKIKVREETPAVNSNLAKRSNEPSTSLHSTSEKSLNLPKSPSLLSPPAQEVEKSTVEAFESRIKEEPGALSSPDANYSATKSDDRSWHSRGAKLKAQVMITDHQKGISNSSVCGKMKSPKSVLSTPKSGKKEKSNTKDIRSYFSPPQSWPKKEDAVLSSSLTSPFESPDLKTPPMVKSASPSSSKSPCQKRLGFQRTPSHKKFPPQSLFSPPLAKTKQAGFSPVSLRGKKRGRKTNNPSNPNMDIRRFLEMTPSTSPKQTSKKSPKKTLLPFSSPHTPPPEKKPRLDIVKSEQPEEIPTFEGFDSMDRKTILRCQILQDYVDVLNTNTLFDVDQYPLPLDQLCDWNDELLKQMLFEKG